MTWEPRTFVSEDGLEVMVNQDPDRLYLALRGPTDTAWGPPLAETTRFRQTPDRKERTMLGYVITKEGQQALDVFPHESVRFAASLESGEGFAAFEGDLGVVNAIATLTQGRILTVFEPDLWLPLCPKRQAGSGKEIFSLMPVAPAEALDTLSHLNGWFPDAYLAIVTGNAVEDDGGFHILIETQDTAVAGTDWSSGVVEFLDKRLVSV